MVNRLQKVKKILNKFDRISRYLAVGGIVLIGIVFSFSSIGRLAAQTTDGGDFCDRGLTSTKTAQKAFVGCAGSAKTDQLECFAKFGSDNEVCKNIRGSNPTGLGLGSFAAITEILSLSGPDLDAINLTEIDLASELSKENPDEDRVALLEKSLNDVKESSGSGLNDITYALTHELLDQRPGSAVDHVTDTVYAVFNADTVNAQQFYYPGTGFQLLQPIQELWGWSVNFAFGFLILIVIGVALAILFGNSLPSGTTVTIQSAIPNIAMALILIPLSYAISGVFIDGITLGTNVVHGFFLSENAPASEVAKEYNSRNPGGRGLFADDPQLILINNANVFDSDRQLVNIQDEVGNFTPVQTIQTTVNNALGVVGVAPDANWIGTIINFFLQLLILFTSLRIFAKLLKKYLYLILIPPFAPFMFLTVAIPGNGTKVIGEYAKLLGSATAAFVVTYSMLILSKILSDEAFASSVPAFGATGYVPPLLGFQQLFSGAASSVSGSDSLTAFILAIIGIAVYLNIPKTLETIDEAIGIDTALPAFITNAWESGKDSVNLARQTGNAAVTAGKAARNAPSSINRRLNQTAQSARNLYDRTFRGYEPGEVGSQLYQRREDIQSQIGADKRLRARQLQDGNTTAAKQTAARIKRRERDLDAISTSIGVSEDFKEQKSGSLKVEFAWLQSKGAIILTRNAILDIIKNATGNSYPNLQAFLSSPGNKEIVHELPPLGKFTFQAENFQMPGNFGNTVWVSQAIERNLRVVNSSGNIETVKPESVPGFRSLNNPPFGLQVSPTETAPGPNQGTGQTNRRDSGYQSTSVRPAPGAGTISIGERSLESIASGNQHLSDLGKHAYIKMRSFKVEPTSGSGNTWDFGVSLQIRDLKEWVKELNYVAGGQSMEMIFKAKVYGTESDGPESNPVKVYLNLVDS